MGAQKPINPEDIKTDLGRRLFRLLSSAMISSVRELARRTEIDRTTVHRWFTKTETPEYPHLMKLSDVLLVDTNVILGIEPIPAVDPPVERHRFIDRFLALDKTFLEHLQIILGCEHCRPHREKIISFLRAIEIALQTNPRV